MRNSHQKKLFLIFEVFLVLTICLLQITDHLKQNIFIAFAIATILAFLLSFLLENRFAHSLEGILDFIRKIPHENYEKKLRGYSHGRLKILADELNAMADDFKTKVSKISNDKKELQQILSSMVEGVILIDKDERLRLLSSPALDMLELSNGKVEGRPYWEVIRNDKVNSAIKKAFASRTIIKEELSTIFPKEQNFSMRISPVLNEEGELISITAVFYDITELTKLEKIKSEFVSNVSHELKTPLTSIKGFVETLQDGAIADKENALKFLNIIYKHTKRLENLVNDILNLSSIESRTFALIMEKIDIGHMLNGVVDFHRKQFESKHQSVQIELQTHIPSIEGDAKKLEQVFFNLLENAIKYTPEQGKIKLSVKVENEYVRIDIIDNGIGISAQHLPRLFERFYRVNKDRSRDLGGTGLGLAIVKHIVQAHRGKLAVKSDFGRGSVFSVFLPKS